MKKNMVTKTIYVKLIDEKQHRYLLTVLFYRAILSLEYCDDFYECDYYEPFLKMLKKHLNADKLEFIQY